MWNSDTSRTRTAFSALLLTLIVTWPATSGATPILINEVKYRAPGADSTADIFTELFGSPGASLAGYSLIGINGANGKVYRHVDLSGGTILVDGVFVISTATVSDPDVLSNRDWVANVDWQNGAGDALWLLDAGNSVVDALQYAGQALTGFHGEGSAASATTDYESLSRDGAGRDSGDNLADFHAATPTPGTGPTISVAAPSGLPPALAAALVFAGLRRREHRHHD